jgi:translation elongation factor P/translation initiation factor 5A
MTKAEFNELKVGDKFECLGKVYEVAELEDFAIEPGKHDLYALTTTDGSRVKKQDSIVEDFEKIAS